MHAMMRPENSPSPSLPPGFRFHPTDEELILHYLKNRSSSLPCPVSIIAEVDIYKYNPWDLPAMAAFGDTEWYFFTPRDRKYPNGIRPNRAAASGYWKATGTDKPITTAADPGAGRSGSVNIGVKKALVFYRGKPPKGTKTSWIMHEYRLTTDSPANNFRHLYRPPKVDSKDVSMRLDEWVLCRIYKKTNHLFVRGETEYRRREAEEEKEEGGRNSNVLVGDPYMANLGSTNVDYIFPKPPSLTELVQNNEMISHLLHQIPPAPEHHRNPNYDLQLPQIHHGPSDHPERGENDNDARFSGMNHPNTSGTSTSGNFNNQFMIDAFNHPFHYLQNLQ